MKSAKNETACHKLRVAVGVPWDGSRLWVQQRSETGPLDGSWEFPGGKIEAGESPRQALLRELQEEARLVLDPDRVQPLLVEVFRYPDRTVELHFFLCRVEPTSLPASGKWMKPSELAGRPVPAANLPLISLLTRISHTLSS